MLGNNHVPIGHNDGNICSGNAEKRVHSGNSSSILNNPDDNVAFLPFGSGTRSCVGQKFVIQGVATLFASLLEQYEVCAIISYLFLPIFTLANKV